MHSVVSQRQMAAIRGSRPRENGGLGQENRDGASDGRRTLQSRSRATMHRHGTMATMFHGKEQRSAGSYLAARLIARAD